MVKNLKASAFFFTVIQASSKNYISIDHRSSVENGKVLKSKGLSFEINF